MHIDNIIKDLYDLDGQSISEVLDMVPITWHDWQPELKAFNPEGWEIAMVCWSSLEYFDSESYFYDSEGKTIKFDKIYDFFWSLPWEIITKEDLLNII